MADNLASPLVALTRAEIAAAEARCAQATEGPWWVGPTPYYPVTMYDGGDATPLRESWFGKDATFIAFARVDLPRALVGNAAYLALVGRIEQHAEKLERITREPAERGGSPRGEVFATLCHQEARELRALLAHRDAQLAAVRTLRDRCWTMREQENAEEMRWFAQELDKALADPPRVADRLTPEQREQLERERWYIPCWYQDVLRQHDLLIAILDEHCPRPEPEGETT